MEQKQRLFIYDRREVVVLVLLGVMVAVFSFTLGVHLGKRVTTHAPTSTTAEVKQIGTLQDTLPNRQELTEQGRDAQAAADSELTNTLHEEVKKTGIQLTHPRQVDLPTKTVSENGGATTLNALPAIEPETKPRVQDEKAHVAFTLQIGSFPTSEEATAKKDVLHALGLKPFVRTAQVPGLGRRFRLYVGGFRTKEAAEKAGRKYLSERMIESYLVSRYE